MIKFRIIPGITQKIESRPIIIDSPVSYPFDFSILPSGSLFTDFLQHRLSDAVCNSFWKSIYPRFVPFVQLDLPFLVLLVHSLLCDSVPLNEIIKTNFVGTTAPPIDLNVLLTNVSKSEFINLFLREFELWVADPAKHGIWKNNSEAYLVAQKDVCCECVVFGKRLLVVGETAVESPVSGLALPLGQLARSGVELVRFARNAVAVLIALDELDQFERVREIALKGVTMGSIVLCSPDVYTVDHFIEKLAP
jgi:hypothetical protein